MLPEQPDSPRQPELRIADADRQRVVALLRDACGEGRITLDEFSERAGAVFAARTAAELEAVTRDLPVPSSVTQETTLARRDTTSAVIAVMSSADRRTPWRAAERISAFSFWGSVRLDLRAAEIESAEIEISATAIMGGIDIIVPEGIKVEFSGMPIMGGTECRVKDVPRLPGTPVVRVKAFAFWGGVTVRSRPSRAVEREQKAARDERHELDDRDRARRERPRLPAPPPMPPLPTPPRGPGSHRHGDARRRPDRRPPRSRYDERDAEPAHEAPAEPRPPVVPTDGTVTVLFSDIENFTALTEHLGDLRAQDILRAHNEIVRRQLAAHGGHEVKCAGDSFMVAFDGARRALRCAVGIQRSFAAYAYKHPGEQVRVRIGLHTGEAIREADDFFGKAVIVASRITSHATGGEILVSALLRELTDSSGEFHFEEPRDTALKGLTGTHRLYPVSWDKD